MQNKKTVRNDIILVITIFALAFAVFLIFRLTMKEGDYALVTRDGEEIGRYSLDEDISVKLQSADSAYNILVIKDGMASIESASCPDGICVDHRSIKYTGESIVCLPNKIVVTIVGEGSAPDVDAVS